MIVDPARCPRQDADDGGSILFLSTGGGLTQFGAYIDTLMPGAFSSTRHWHSAEDEFLLVLTGTATVIDDAGAQDLDPGDAASWRHGDPNAHHVTNRTGLPCRFLIVGSRAVGDICTYPDKGQRQINGLTDWKVVAADGTVLRGGDLPPELLNLRPVWGRPFDGSPRPSLIRKGSVPGTSDPGSSPFKDLGDYVAHPLSDAGGLTQFGAFTETLMPGARSSHRHWHSDEDEFLYTLDGIVTLHENDGPTDLVPGSCVCWPAGTANAHCVENRTDAPVTYFVAGSRLPDDTVTYPDIDMHYVRRDGLRTLSRKDGTPYPGWPKETNR